VSSGRRPPLAPPPPRVPPAPRAWGDGRGARLRTGELLLEILSEEIPARMQRRAIEDLTDLIRDKLAAAEIPAVDLHGYVTPRRLAVIADGIPATQPDRTEERRGPRLGAPQPAIDGFLRSAGLGSIEDCEVRDSGRGQFYFAVVRNSGRQTSEVLPDLIRAAIVELPWPKSMRWPGAPLRWVRPLTSIICLYDGKVLPLALEGVAVGRTTRGHRFLSSGEICLADAADYVEKLEQAYVIVDQDRRKEVIRADLDSRAAELGVAVKPDPALLDEVNGLAEFPVVLAGAIDADFVKPLPEGLPPEVLQTAMRTHQKYFSCVHPDGRPAPHFLFVANNLAEDGGAAIIAGNERVLRARLADARFFWDQDCKTRLRSRIEQLKQRVYHEKLGNMFEKARRMAVIAEDLARQLNADPQLAFGAALLAKADLSTSMVGEFPELQGVMGCYYALNDREDARVADAIADHYRPLGPSDDCPAEPVSVVVALADKVDSLISFFAIGEKPTGSRDPFALRRAALGVIRLTLENNLRLPLTQVFRDAWMQINIGGNDPTNEVIAFILERLKVHLREQRVRHDLIAAAFIRTTGIPEVKHLEDDLVRLIARVRALESFLSTDDGANLLIAYRRASNIVSIEEKKEGAPGRYRDRAPDATRGTMLKQPEEVALVDRFMAILPDAVLQGENFAAAMELLATLRRPVDDFFDKVMINTKETVIVDGVTKSLRENRLRLLSAIRATMNRVADFSLIEG
jgi:glycyl-tRNA synthetase beta chain